MRFCAIFEVFAYFINVGLYLIGMLILGTLNAQSIFCITSDSSLSAMHIDFFVSSDIITLFLSYFIFALYKTSVLICSLIIFITNTGIDAQDSC